jgi:fructokinase
MSQYDIYGLGNALVDMEFAIDDRFLSTHEIAKGHMTLVDEERIDHLLNNLAEFPVKRASGGSAANTLIAAQAMGAATFYSCKVAGDETGAYFVEDLTRVGVDTNPHGTVAAGTSGRCLVLVTPDAERSMNTFLGISDQLAEPEMNEAALRASKALYIEGYLSSSESARHAAVRCREMAEDNGTRVALTLSDPSMVEFFREPLELMLGNGVDHLFCNEEEALGWAGTDRLDVAVAELKDIARSLNITLGARGSLVVNNDSQAEVPGYPVKAIDTNGAGDIYAGACLYGWSQGMSDAAAAALGNFAASRLVTHYGARLSEEGYRAVRDEFQT